MEDQGHKVLLRFLEAREKRASVPAGLWPDEEREVAESYLRLVDGAEVADGQIHGLRLLRSYLLPNVRKVFRLARPRANLPLLAQA